MQIIQIKRKKEGTELFQSIVFKDCSVDIYRERNLWQAKEQKIEGTLAGRVKKFIFTIGLKPFFDKKVSTSMMSLALSLPETSCNMKIIEWYLAAGVMLHINEILADVKGRFNRLAGEDGIVNELEHYILQFIAFLSFPAFLAELSIFLYIRQVLELYMKCIHTQCYARQI